MPNSIDGLTHNGQTIPDLFELVARCENRTRIQQDVDQLANFWIHGAPPKDEEEDDGAIAQDYDPQHGYFFGGLS